MVNDEVARINRALIDSLGPVSIFRDYDGKLVMLPVKMAEDRMREPNNGFIGTYMKGVAPEDIMADLCPDLTGGLLA